MAMAGALLLLSRLGQDARERESEGKESEAMRRAPAAAGWLRLGGRRMGQDGENGNRHVGPTATWTWASAKPPAKTIRWPKSDGFDSWVAKDTRFCNSMAKTKPRPELNG